MKNNINKNFVSILMICILFLLLYSAFSNNSNIRTIQNQNAINKILYEQELQKIEKNAEAIGFMLISEILLQKGDLSSALGGYATLLHKTNDIAIAKRTAELALYIKDYALVEAILKKWQQIELTPSFDQKLIIWKRNIIFKKNIDTIIQDFPYIMNNANTNEQKMAFIWMLDLAKDKNISIKVYRLVHKYAKKYDDYIEAAVADLIFSANSNHKLQAQKALQKLAKQDPVLTPNLGLYLNLIYKYLPEDKYLTEVFNNYFKKLSNAEVEKLTDLWITLYVESQLRMHNIDKAYNAIVQHLDKNPSSEIYLQAGYISTFKNKDPSVAQNYFEKSYSLANQTQYSRIALVAAIRLINLNSTNLASQWVNKIDEKQYPFDKNFLIAMCAFNNKNWNLLEMKLEELSKSKITKGSFYSQSDVVQLSSLTLSLRFPPQQALNKLNVEIDKYKNQLNKFAEFKSATNTTNKQLLTEELSNLMYQRALILADKFDNYEDAIKDFEYYLKLHPNNSDALNSLGYTMIQIPTQIDKGLNLIKKSYKLNPKDKGINDSLGWAYYLKKEYKKGLLYLEYVYNNLINDATTISHLAAIYSELGFIDKAIKLFKEAYKLDNKNKELLKLLKKYNVEM